MINRFSAAISLSSTGFYVAHHSLELCDDDYDELLNVNNLSTNENKFDTGFQLCPCAGALR